MVLDRDSGWLRIDEHPSWFVWKVPSEFDSSGICEDVTADQMGPRPTAGATLLPGKIFEFTWKTNVFGADEVRHGALGASHCIHVAPAPQGSYGAKLCANLNSIACSVPPSSAEFPTQCLPVTLEIGPGDTSVSADFTADQFPTNRCAADG